MTDRAPALRPWYVRYPVALWKYFVGVLFCQYVLGAVVVVGWTTRFMQRQILWAWWKRRPLQNRGGSFDEFAASLPNRCVPRTLPNWCLAEPQHQDSQHDSDGRFRRLLRRALGSLSVNFCQGATATLSILIFTLPATSLWIYAWTLGWNISFFKLYEQSHLGASLGLLGILLFILAMLYVPLAHARQAVTGRCQSFFELRTNWCLARRHPTVMLPVALLFVVASGVVMILRIAPYYLGSQAEISLLSLEELRHWLENYYFIAGAILLPAYILVWLAVAKAYACAAASEYIADPVGGSLGDWERETLGRLQLQVQTTEAAHPLMRGTSWTFSRFASTGALGLTCLAWFGVAAQVFVAQFLNYLPGATWLNHPLVLLPWIRYLPPGLTP